MGNTSNIKDIFNSVVSNKLKENSEILDFRNDEIGDDGLIHLTKSTMENTVIKSLNLSKNKITSEGLKVFCETNKIINLKNLDLSENNFGEKGVIYLTEYMKKNKTIKNLNISLNGIGHMGAVKFSECLRNNKTLLRLNLSGNKFEINTLDHMTNNFIVNNTLECLYLSHNLLGLGAFCSLFLPKNTSISVLSLSHSQLQDVNDLFKSLENNSTLCKLDLRFNSLNYINEESVCKVLKNKALHYLDFRGNFLLSYNPININALLRENNVVLKLKYTALMIRKVKGSPLSIFPRRLLLYILEFVK
eukprot:TRINITY_DN15768_c0_g1_i1.p1 TRINITY_DN15768_c0_g1~~TRINITY_DN15768_c0_g1_i1.p1  ORF type:complete len:304 (-),score=47.62 TRINITY_DN15768_c0_g1_i1:21-932(-)